MLSRTFDIDLFPGLLCDQRQNGRCWIYASLAPFRQKLDVQLSTNYVYYFDQMRKAKAFLAKIEEWKNRELNDPELSALLREPISTVGQWCYFASLVSAHGLVPTVCYVGDVNFREATEEPLLALLDTDPAALLLEGTAEGLRIAARVKARL